MAATGAPARAITWLVLVFAVAVLAWPLHADAASPEGGDPTYNVVRYNDNFTYLSDPTKATDFWDGIKYIPLGDGRFGASYLSLGGELRERFESYINPNFGIKAPDSNAYLLHRLLLDADLHVNDYLRVFLQLGDMERLGNRGTPTTTDIDELDVMQGFVDLRAPTPLGDAPTLRVGQAEMAYGFQRLVALREGPNVRRAFDGFRLSDALGGATIDLFAVRPVVDNTGVFDDHSNLNQSLWGGYLTVPVAGALKADLYWMGYDNAAGRFRGQTGFESRQTVGTRLFGAADGWDWNSEAALQGGRFRGNDIRAWLLASIAGYTFRGLPWQPRLALEANAASGDSGHGTLGTFNALYPRLPYFAETPLLVPANIYDIRPVLSVKPTPVVTAVFGWDTLWRTSLHDGLYGSAETLFPGTNKTTGSRVGTELSADVRWRLDRHLTLGAIFAELFAGPAITEAGGKSVSYFVLFGTYRF
jgi:hypothetical protein